MDDLNQHINVTFLINWDEKFDLRIPVNVSVRQLILDVEKALYDQINIQRTGFEIRLINKNIIMTDNQKLIDFGISNGDLLTII